MSNKITLNKVLISIIIALVLVIIAGTIIAKTTQKTQTPEVLLSQGKAVSLLAPADDSVVAYYELGTIRILTQTQNEDSEGVILVVSPWLAYPAEDTVFYEEIARKKGVIKGIFQTYFTERTKKQLLEETEIKIEEILKDQINQQLSLGKISDIYFTDYIFLE